jgi:acetoacetate decarboxylase
MPYPYKGLMSRDTTLYMLTYTTTHEAIKKVLTPPLEPMLDMPPVVTVWIGHARHWRWFNGKLSHYWEFGFFIPCRYKDYMGVTPMWTLMDSPTGDQTEGGELGMVSGREVTGWMKSMGNVRIGGTGDQVHGTCDVRGVRIITFDIETPEEITTDQLPTSGVDQFLFVKEIPNCNFTGYDVRKVIGMKSGFLSRPDAVYNLRKGTGSVQYGHLETHPVDILEVVEPGPAYQLTFDIAYDEAVTNGAFEIENLLK